MLYRYIYKRRAILNFISYQYSKILSYYYLFNVYYFTYEQNLECFSINFELVNFIRIYDNL